MSACSGPVATDNPAEGADTLAWYHNRLADAQQRNDQPRAVALFQKIGNYHYDKQHLDSAIHYYSAQEKTAAQQAMRHEQVTALIDLSRCYTDLLDDDQTYRVLDSALQVSKANDNIKDKAWVVQEMAIYYYYKNEDDSAIKYYLKELEYDSILKDYKSASACMSNMAVAYMDKGDYSQSIRYYERAIQLGTAIHNDTAVAKYRTNLGIAYKQAGIYDLALEQLLEAARFWDEIKSVKEQTSCYNAMGNIYIGLNQLDKALEYHMLALQYRQDSGYVKGIAMSLTSVGEVFMRRGKYDSALDYLQRSLKIKEELKDTALIASSLELMGETYYLLRDFNTAQQYYFRSLPMRVIAHDPKGKATTLNKIGQLYAGWNKPDSALVRLAQGRAILEHVPAKKELLENYKMTIDLLRLKGRSEEAWNYNTKFIELKDSLLDEQKTTDIANMEVKYETEKIERQVIELNEKNEMQLALVDRQTKLIYAFLFGFGLLIVVLVLTVVAYRSRRKAHRQSEVIIWQKQTIIDHEQMMMKELHHRVKNNLQVLSNILQLQQEKISDEEILKMMQAVGLKVDAMLFVHRELSSKRADSLINMRNYLDNLVRNLIASFDIDRAQVDVNLQVDELYFKSDKALNIGFICNEALSNSFKHARRSNVVLRLQLTLQSKEQDIYLLLGDNGPGFPANVDVLRKQSLGLSLIDLFSQTLNAKLNTNSGNSGTTVELRIPKTDSVR